MEKNITKINIKKKLYGIPLVFCIVGLVTLLFYVSYLQDKQIPLIKEAEYLRERIKDNHERFKQEEDYSSIIPIEYEIERLEAYKKIAKTAAILCFLLSILLIILLIVNKGEYIKIKNA